MTCLSNLPVPIFVHIAYNVTTFEVVDYGRQKKKHKNVHAVSCLCMKHV